jgi:hypothetical protein
MRAQKESRVGSLGRFATRTAFHNFAERKKFSGFGWPWGRNLARKAVLMLRGPVLLRLALRVPLARAALPLLAAYAPEAFRLPSARGLHVYVRTAIHDEFSKVEVGDGADAGDLKKAVIAELKLDMAPNCVRLLREIEGGGAPVPLDSRRGLAIQGVREGSCVVIVAVPPAAAAAAAAPATAQWALPPPPPPLVFAEQLLGGEPVMVASVPLAQGCEAPFYLTRREHAGILRFLAGTPSSIPQMLMLTGPVKCGKTSIMQHVLPGMLAARHAAGARRAVIFRHTCIRGFDGERAADALVRSLLDFAEGEGIALRRPQLPGLEALPQVAAQLARGVQVAGGELWLLLDELGAPIVASTPAGARAFTQQLKTMVEMCSFHARTVGTGSGMVALLTAIRDASPHSFVLWDAITHVSLGREPAPPVALAMAQGIHGAYAPSCWPPHLARTITPQGLLAQLQRSAHCQLTSPRPALVACLAGLLSTASLGSSSAEGVLAAAVGMLVAKLREESSLDALVGLERMRLSQRRALRALAVHSAPPNAAFDAAAAAFVALLCEEGEPVQLAPPNGALLGSWIARDGSLAACSSTEGSALAEAVKLNLDALHTYHALLPRATAAAASAAVLQVLASNGIGSPGPGQPWATCPPSTLEEFAALPAVVALLQLLGLEAQERNRQQSPSSAQLAKALRAAPDSQKRFMEEAGLTLLLWMRHVSAHAAFFVTDELPRAGLSSAVVKDAVQAALEVIVRDCGEEMGLGLSEKGVLVSKRLLAAAAAAPRAQGQSVSESALAD